MGGVNKDHGGRDPVMELWHDGVGTQKYEEDKKTLAQRSLSSGLCICGFTESGNSCSLRSCCLLGGNDGWSGLFIP